MVEAYRDGDTAPREDTMTRATAHTITIPAEVTSIAIEAWDNDYGTQDGIIWDRTGHTDDDGEWGNELFEWVGHLDDVRAAAKRAGFEVGEFVTQTIDGETEVFATATR